jgi:secreted trypsin-like serine protease
MYQKFIISLIASGLLTATGALPAHAQTMQTTLRGLAPSVALRILGGVEASDGAWPWQTFLQIPVVIGKDKAILQCGGSFISARWVLTAAHCFVPADGSLDKSKKIVVVEGLKRIGLGPKEKPEFTALHQTGEAFVHPHYNQQTHENDIALVHLNEGANVENVTPLLTTNAFLENPPLSATVTGWGHMKDVEQTNDGKYLDSVTHSEVALNEVVATHLMQVTLPLVSVAECKTRNKEVDGVIDERNICAGIPEGGKDSCQGDSGGPLVAQRTDGQWAQIGVVSWGIGCGRAGYPGVYTRVSAFADWIKSVAGRDLTIAQDPPPEPHHESQQEPQPNPGYDNAAGVAIAFDKGDNVHLGDLVAYRVTTRKAGYITILDATPDGKLTQIFPNKRSLASPGGTRLEAIQINPGRPLLVPNYNNPYAGFAVRVSGERGKGVMVAVLSDEPLTSLDIPDAPKTFSSTTEALSFIDRLRTALTRNLAVQGNGAARTDKPNWSVDMHEYNVE